MRLFNEEVYFTKDDVVKVKRSIINFLKSKSLKNKRKRIRLCAHKNIKDELHEMFIVHNKGIYIRPHKHLKEESLHVISGRADIILLNENGSIKNLIHIGEYSSGNDFYFRLPPSYYHTMIIKSDFLIFHETKAGPFDKKNTTFAPWAPEETDIEKVTIFQRSLKTKIKNFGQSRKKTHA